MRAAIYYVREICQQCGEAYENDSIQIVPEDNALWVTLRCRRCLSYITHHVPLEWHEMDKWVGSTVREIEKDEEEQVARQYARWFNKLFKTARKVCTKKMAGKV